ncbi:prohead peptidase. Unknown type peptidase. MEROPS family U35 [Sphingomonas laterariae]|uniref:Prohead serine protease domain-containing protein n=1 Tax=Edaphosphingomonas laterariae TaxID=861865 RepID=A0A239F8Z0_9SPHN|nr:prohead peptidase. Unknown type peptidase. MEROPS family U35 [Sphingomonas laterariae]
MLRTKNCGLTLDVKAIGDDGVIEGYASMFNVVDSYNEMVAPGAFKASLATAKREKRAVKMLYQHDTWTVIGVWDEVAEDEKGLRVRGRLLKDISPKAAEVYGLVREGALDELSIGYREIETAPDRQQDGVTVLKKLDLREVSIVTFGALGRAARIDEVKSIQDGGRNLTIREFEGFLRDAGFSRKMAEAISASSRPHLRGEPGAQADDAAVRFLRAMRG